MPDQSMLNSITQSVHTIEVDGRSRSYTLVTPTIAQKSAPLVLVFHGSNQTGEHMRMFSGNVFDELAQLHGCVVVYADGYQKHWNDARLSTNFAARKDGVDDVAFTKALIDKIPMEYDIDAGRVYLVGYSNGGQMVIRLIHEWPYPFAGAMIISATQPVSENFPTFTQETSLPVLLIHGTADPLVPYNGGEASLWGFNPRGRGLSAPETARYYARRNHIDSEPTVSTFANDPNDLKVTVEDYHADGAYPVRLLSIEDGGHVVPNLHKKVPFLLGKTVQIDSAELFWDFFQPA
jgi:polyhydroxybutyrate depolymerase